MLIFHLKKKKNKRGNIIIDKITKNLPLDNDYICSI